MSSPAIIAMQQTENRLTAIYESLHKKERLMASKINTFTNKKQCYNATQAIFINITLNLSCLLGLFYLLY